MCNQQITPATRVVAIENQVSCNLGSDTVILHLKEGTYFGLNEVGSAVWKLIQQPQSIANICDSINTDFDVEPERCQRDITELIASLLQAGLVQLA